MSHFPVKEKWDFFFKPSHALLHQTTTMNGILDSIGSAITTVSDFVCGYPLFILLIGGGLFLFFYSGAVSLRRIGYSIKALRYKSEVAGEGQISSFQALMSAIASTVGMGNIAGVAIAITVGGPGAIFLDVGKCRCGYVHQIL